MLEIPDESACHSCSHVREQEKHPYCKTWCAQNESNWSLLPHNLPILTCAGKKNNTELMTERRKKKRRQKERRLS